MNESELCKLQVAIDGMSCAACSARIERGLERLDGVDQASVNLATERAELAFDPERVTPEQVLKTIESLGYQPRVAEV